MAAAAMLGTLLTACSDGDVEAAEEPDTAAQQEFQKAREALANWSEMKAEDFEQSANRVLQATERRIESLREKIADSKAAADARQTLDELKQERDRLGEQLRELRGAAADQAHEARKAIVDGFDEFQNRVSKAWDALTARESDRR